jgi:SAM-dependent methyltransferase
MRVLDVGCGTGDDVRAIAEIVGPQGRTTGIDSNAALVEEARARGIPPNAAFLTGDAAALPFEDASFDAVRAERVFQHLHDPQKAAAELHRVLRDGGSAFLLDQDWETLAIAGADGDVTRRIVRSLADRFANARAGRNLRGLLHGAGFRHVDVAPTVAAPPFGIARDVIIAPALEAAVREGSVAAEEAERWRLALVEADRTGAFFCAVTVVAALAR